MVAAEQIVLALGWPVHEMSRRRVVDQAAELGLADDGAGYSEADAWRVLAALRVEVAAAQAADARAQRAEQGLPAQDPEDIARRMPFFHRWLGRGEPSAESAVWPSWPASAKELA